MNIHEIRLENLRRLVAEIGTLRDVADLSDVSEGNLREILRGGKLPSGKPKGVGNKLARKLEEGCNNPDGWMDSLQSAPKEPRQDELHLSPDEQTLLVLYRRASTELRRVILLAAKLAK